MIRCQKLNMICEVVACSNIGECWAKKHETEQKIIKIIFPHPTLSKMMLESTLEAHGRVIHF